MADLQTSDRHAPQDRWPNAMAAALGQGWTVIAEGHPGRTSVFDDPVEGAHKNGLTVLPALLETHRPLDLVIIMLGTNDTKARFGAPAIDIARGVERLVRTIRASESGPEKKAPEILIAAPVPIEEVGTMTDMFAGGAAKSRALAPHLADVAERHGAGFIDLALVATVDPLDGIHLTAEAHHAIGSAMAQTVQNLFKA